MTIIDSDGTQPVDTTIPSYHGRQRSLRRVAVPGPLRHVPRALGQVLLRVHLRHRPVRIDGPALDVCAHDPSRRTGRGRPDGTRTEGPRQFLVVGTRRRTFLKHPDVFSERECLGVLFFALGVHGLVWCPFAHGHRVGIRADGGRGGMVHFQQFRYVCECGKDEWDAWTRCVPSCTFLSGIRDHGHLLK